MQAYRYSSSSSCDDESSQQQQQQQLYRASSQQQQQYAAAGGGMQRQQYAAASGMQQQQYAAAGGMQQKHHQQYAMQQQQAVVQQPAAGIVMQKSSSFQTKTTMTVFGQDPFCEITPSHFPPGTDPKIVECFNRIDRDGNGVVCDRELQAVLSSCNHSFNMRTVHLLMFDFTHSNKRMIGPREFVPLMQCLQLWRTMFQKYDRDRNGSIDSCELGQALHGLNYKVSPVIVNLLISKFTKNGGYSRCSLQYDSFIECCLTVKGLSETFQAKAECGRATFCYEEFLLNVLPFIIA